MATYNHTEYLRSLAAAEAERLEFLENFAGSETAQRHAALTGRREAEFAERMDSGLASAQTKLAAEIQRNAPGLPLADAHRLAARRLGIIK